MQPRSGAFGYFLWTREKALTDNGGARSAAEALGRGDLLAAYDLAEMALEEAPGSEEPEYVRVLALARMGSGKAALATYFASRLPASADLRHRALLGRLLKDEADAAAPGERARAYAAAADAYRRVYEETGDPFPGINAATLAFLAGDRSGAERLARQILAQPAVTEAPDYFAAATRAEALLLLGDAVAAEEALRRALELPGADQSARAATLRQLRRLLPEGSAGAGRNERLLDLLRAAPILTYCGHMFRPDAGAEARIGTAIDARLDELGTRTAYGSLACGADILTAEAILRRGGELNVVLPFDVEAFVGRSVSPGGETWLPRFHRCLAGARSVTHASLSDYVGDRGQFRFGLLLAMGLARLRAEPLGAVAVQLAVWDGQGADADAGTGAEVRRWRSSGGRTVVVEPGAVDRRCGQRLLARDHLPERALRAILFADFAGFSGLPEAELPAFTSEVLGSVSKVLRRYAASVCARNTWGDGIFVILDSAAAAAAVATELQEALAPTERSLSWGRPGGLRIGLHFAPVYQAEDPVTGAQTFFGREVNCAARIEPVTPVGGVYGTRPLAAMLAMEAAGRFDLTYLGRVDLAKGFAKIPMYRIERRSAREAAAGPTDRTG
jgi:tetratricopeptide (TPR) repeat protein